MVKNNYISYSLWGNQAIYCVGILQNIKQAKELYPGWQVIVYLDESVPDEVVAQIREAGAKVVDMTNISYGMFWRFFAADLPDCQFVIFRDSDSRLTLREKLAVEEWINSGKAIHVMRDHPYHEIPYGSDKTSILGGMWGIKGNIVPMKEMILTFSEKKDLGYGIDQAFLKEIYDRFENDAVTHDEFFSNKPFPIKRFGYRFIGERIDENEQPVGDDWQVVRAYYENRPGLKNRLLKLCKKCVRFFSKI